MVVHMSYQRSLRFSVISLVVAGFLSPLPVQAQLETQTLVKAMQETAEKTSQESQANTDRLIKVMAEAAIKRVDAQIQLEKARTRAALEPAIDMGVMVSLQSVPVASALTALISSSVLESRYKELNLIKQNSVGTLARGLVDSTTGSLANDPANFRVYMDYFCDPRAQDGEMGKIGDTAAIAANSAYDVKDETTKYQYKCGVERYKVLGNPGNDPDAQTPVAIENYQITGLPLKPQLLFFEPLTFPMKPSSTATDESNTNKLSDLAFGAYKYFERLILGKPGDKTKVYNLTTSGGREAYIADQSRIARQMLASYPFAMLFAERMGTMGGGAAQANSATTGALSAPQAAAKILRTSWAGVTMDPNIDALIRNLEDQKSMSMAQYMDILMYKMPMSAGYLARINQLSPEQLDREEVFLMGLQTVLKYKINRWMEMSTVYAAVKS